MTNEIGILDLFFISVLFLPLASTMQNSRNNAA